MLQSDIIFQPNRQQCFIRSSSRSQIVDDVPYQHICDHLSLIIYYTLHLTDTNKNIEYRNSSEHIRETMVVFGGIES